MLYQFKVAVSIITVFLLGFFFSVASAMEKPLACKGKLTVVDGTVNTINTSSTQQSGQINIVLSPLGGGAPIFAENGMILGEVQKQLRIQTLLNHHIEFASGGIKTENDVAILKMPPIGFEVDGTPCAFGVFESIYNISGTGLFDKAKALITAEGTVSFCSYNNQNNFTLNGVICLDG
ncbi:hypothetical protein [Spartinivicinus ruber]|uniref:hypothetical protein n=1 Tax=Spartinivicinus ruber TaxID=2683272 RepID=UPI0013D0F678|nr:hypothetical protein [Spartinivicinus ruber]